MGVRNLLHCCLANGWGGLEQYPIKTYAELKRFIPNISVLTIEGSELHEACLELGIPVDTVPHFKRVSPRIVATMRRVIAERKIEVIHSHKNGELYNLFFALRKHPEVRLIMTYHMGVPNKNDPLHRFFYNRVNRILAITDVHRKLMVERLPVDTSKLRTLHFGVDTSHFRPEIPGGVFRTEWEIPNDALVFLAVANVSEPKGVAEFFAAAKQLIPRYPQAYFVWVGDDKHCENSHALLDYRTKAKEAGLEGRLIFTGFRRDIPHIMRDASVFALPSRHEAFGLVYIEAMTMGLPIVACLSGGVPELVEQGVQGELVRSRDSEAFTTALEKFIQEPRRIDIYKKAALHRATEFSMGCHIERLMRIYAGVD